MNIGTVMKLSYTPKHNIQNRFTTTMARISLNTKKLSELLKMLGCSPLTEYCVTDLRRW